MPRARRSQQNIGTKNLIPVTNAVEALHRSLRKIIKTRGSFPNDDAALKLLYLAIKNAGLRWRRPVDWTAAMGQFAIQFGERFPGTTR
jgi:putative transposase